MAKKTESNEPLEDRLVKADADGALEAVRGAGARVDDLVQAWLDAGNAAAIAEVAERGEGAARKAARRAINVLRSRKIQIPERKRVATLAAAPAETVEAWMMAPDSGGMQLFAVTSRAPAGRYRASFVFLHGSLGVARVDNANMSQTQLKDYFGKVLPGAGYGATPVPVEWARFRIADARRITRERKLTEPMGFTTAAPLIDPAPGAAPSHPFDDEGFELADEDAAELAKSSGLLHNVPEFRSWLPTNNAMQELLVNVGSKLAPGETPDPQAVTDHLRSEAEAATDRFFSPEVREELVRRMKDSALSALAREGEQRALEVVAAMKMIEKCGLVTDPPRDVPFLKAFFDKAVALMLAQGGGRLRIPVPAATLPTDAPNDAAPAEAKAEP
jgi:hypothetical protein